jgi:hypothetical protein
MPFEKGQPRPEGAGRRAGVPNRTTASIKAMFEEVIERLGGPDALETWAKENPTEFWKCVSKLLPKDVTVDVNVNIAELIKEARERVLRGRGE